MKRTTAEKVESVLATVGYCTLISGAAFAAYKIFTSDTLAEKIRILKFRIGDLLMHDPQYDEFDNWDDDDEVGEEEPDQRHEYAEEDDDEFESIPGHYHIRFNSLRDEKDRQFGHTSAASSEASVVSGTTSLKDEIDQLRQVIVDQSNKIDNIQTDARIDPAQMANTEDNTYIGQAITGMVNQMNNLEKKVMDLSNMVGGLTKVSDLKPGDRIQAMDGSTVVRRVIPDSEVGGIRVGDDSDDDPETDV